MPVVEGLGRNISHAPIEYQNNCKHRDFGFTGTEILG